MDLNTAMEKIRELMNASSCSQEAKTAAQAWLDAVGTEKEAEETKKYIAELEADILSVDDVIAFTGSEQAVQVFGADTAKKFHAHAKDLKAAGEKYCDCPACTVGRAVLDLIK